MKLSDWAARLWITPAALVLSGCVPDEHPAVTRDRDRVSNMELACKSYLANVRKGWEVTTTDPQVRREWEAIDVMRRACSDLEQSLISDPDR